MIVTPGTERFWSSTTLPVIVPVVVCAEAVPGAAAASSNTETAKNLYMTLLLRAVGRRYNKRKARTLALRCVAAGGEFHNFAPALEAKA